MRGLGIGWRPEIAGVIAELRGLGFCEVIAESVNPSEPPPHLLVLGIPVVPHGISLSLGSVGPVDERRVTHLAACAEALGSPVVSEHIAFVRADGIEAGHLLPMPRTREALDVLSSNIIAAQKSLPVPLAVENVASVVDWADADYTESEFLTELVTRTGVHLVLDIANVYANARNKNRDPWDELRRIPRETVAYCHVAGGSERDGFYHDTHTDPVPDAVLELVRALAENGLPALMLERDGNYPPAHELYDELDAIADAARLPRVTPFDRTPR
ncbi:hypothetical protein GCM10007304_37700 [Rhodococcoides trifolii]|uniref:DUF692 domain-containing protein n=1 Tax=Rhodococcoides trifolii TaxID=908250 RepID=A0A917G311_9NOCA|nr:DUF692 domain-containing protein [Rhodococcus trifolii]GGG20254.1 hypothetical protein GCM10007304_37700 [Rhodococcus trifolii]